MPSTMKTILVTGGAGFFCCSCKGPIAWRAADAIADQIQTAHTTAKELAAKRRQVQLR
jgi:hypothetical protein